MTKKEQLEQLNAEIEALRIIRDSHFGNPNLQDQKIKDNIEKYRKEISEKINKKIEKYNAIKNGTLNKVEFCEVIGIITKIYDNGCLARASIYVKTGNDEERRYPCLSGILKRTSMPFIGQKVVLRSRKTKNRQTFYKYDAKIVKFL